MLINPLLLVDDVVRVKFSENPFDDCPALVEKKGPTYHITINDYVVKKVPEDIRKYFVLGILYHEISHIRYKSFKRSLVIKDKIHQWIDNLLEDARIEFKCASEFPIAAKFITVVLNTTKVFSDILINDKKQDKLEKKLNDMYLIVRYGIIPDDADEDFVNFMFPLFLASMRGERKHSEQAAGLIHEYLMTDFNSKSIVSVAFTDASQIMGSAIVNSNEAQNGETCQQVKTCQQVIDKNVKGDIETQIASIVNEIDKVCGDTRVIDDIITEVLIAVNEQSRFYQSCVREMSKEIDTLTNVLKSLITKHSVEEVFDGDLNVKKQVQAYLDSLVGERNKTYTYHKLNTIDFDCLILRDISGSTETFKFEYFKSLVVIMEALENLKIRSMVVDFNSDAYLVKKFDENKVEDRFVVSAHGDTMLVAALNSIKSMIEWKSKRRLGIIITDGMFSDGYRINEVIQDDKYREVQWVIINIGYVINRLPSEFRYSSVQVSRVEEIPGAFAKIIHEIRF